MEESSEKRRARLQAMRTEASSQSQPLSTSIQGLSNPLTSSAGDERTPKAARFDFYTDPMAAFSGSKTGNPSPGGGRGGGGPYCSPQSFSSPIRSPSPLSYPSNRPSYVNVISPPPTEPATTFEEPIVPPGDISAQATTIASLLSAVLPVVAHSLLSSPPAEGSTIPLPHVQTSVALSEGGTTTIALSSRAEPAPIMGSASEAQTSVPSSEDAMAATTQIHGAEPVQTPGSDLLPSFTAELLPGFMDDFYNNLRRCLGIILKNPKAPLAALKTILSRSIGNIRDLGAVEQAEALVQLVSVFERDVCELRNVRQASLDALIEEEIQALSARMEEQRAKAQVQIDALLQQLEDLKANDEDLNADLELTQAQTEAAAQDIARANDMINKAQQMIAQAQGILEKSEPEYTAGTTHLKELKAESTNLQAQQLQVSKGLKEAEAEKLAALSIAEDQLKREAVNKATLRKEQLITQLENRLNVYLQRRLE